MVWVSVWAPYCFTYGKHKKGDADPHTDISRAVSHLLANGIARTGWDSTAKKATERKHRDRITQPHSFKQCTCHNIAHTRLRDLAWAGGGGDGRHLFKRAHGVVVSHRFACGPWVQIPLCVHSYMIPLVLAFSFLCATALHNPDIIQHRPTSK